MESNRTLYDYRDEAAWLRELGWDEEALRSVPVHDRQHPDEDFLPLPGLAGPYGRQLFIYRRDLSAERWEQISALLSRRGRAGGHRRRGMLTGSQERITDWERPAG